jgi:hypothetical protein
MNFKLKQISITILSMLALSTPAHSAIFGQGSTISNGSHNLDTRVAKLSKQEEEAVQRIMEDYFNQIDYFRGEIGAIRGNFRISNAEKRQILPSFKPKIDNMINSYLEKLRPYSAKDEYGSRILKAMKDTGEYHLYQLLDCPDNNGATMCI